MALKSQLDYARVFSNKSASVFDNMDRLMRMINEADGDDENADENGGEPAPEDAGDGGDQELPPEGEDEMPMGDEGGDPNAMEGDEEDGDPADEDSGIYVSTNEYASLAKTLMDALQANPPKTGEIPSEYLNVTDQNANNVIKFVQAYLQLDLNNSFKDNGEADSFTDELKHI